MVLTPLAAQPLPVPAPPGSKLPGHLLAVWCMSHTQMACWPGHVEMGWGPVLLKLCVGGECAMDQAGGVSSPAGPALAAEQDSSSSPSILVLAVGYGC